MATLYDKVAQTIERFIRTEFRVADKDPMFSCDVDLFEAGFVDSIGFTELLTFIESSWGITVEIDWLLDDGFTTINGISGIISSALAERTRGAAGSETVTEARRT